MLWKIHSHLVWAFEMTTLFIRDPSVKYVTNLIEYQDHISKIIWYSTYNGMINLGKAVKCRTHLSGSGVT